MWFPVGSLLLKKIQFFNGDGVVIGNIASLCCTPQVNSYPTVREFTAIGLGGDDFVQAMVVAVESVLQQQIPEVMTHLSLSDSG